jgi:hypothetical protein
VLLDLGLHAQGMTEREAAAMVTGATLMPDDWARAQLVRAKRIPLQSLTYLVGSTEIAALRAWYGVGRAFASATDRSRSGPRPSMTYRRASAVAASPLERPPQLFGFALYVLGTGALLMGLAQLVLFAMFHHLGWDVGIAVRFGMPVGELMTGLGLVVAWRTASGSNRRLLAASGALWATLLVLELQSAQVRSLLVERLPRASNGAYVASWTGWAIALGLVAVVVSRAGRAFAGRTWATLLGVSLVTAHAFEQAWPIAVPPQLAWRTPTLVPGLMALGGLGLVVFAGGLFASGRSILSGTTIDEDVRAGPKARRSDDDGAEGGDEWPPAAREGLSLFLDAAVAASGLAFALSAATLFAGALRVSASDLADTSVAGGQLLVGALVVLALRRLGPRAARATSVAYGALGCLVARVALVALASSRGSSAAHALALYADGAAPLLVAGTLWAAASALGASASAAHLEAAQALRARLRAAAAALAASGVASFHLPHGIPFGLREALPVAALLGGALAFVASVRAARAGRRLVVARASSDR